jgi:hypothetical protein
LAPCSLKLVKNLQLADHLNLTTAGTENERVTGAGFYPFLTSFREGYRTIPGFWVKAVARGPARCFAGECPLAWRSSLFGSMRSSPPFGE